MNLKDKNCNASTETNKVLDQDNKKILLKDIGMNWTLQESTQRLEASFKFKNFKTALNFVNKISELSESQNHHPEISFGWGYCKIKIWTHTFNDLTENDFILASKIQNIFNQQ